MPYPYATSNYAAGDYYGGSNYAYAAGSIFSVIGKGLKAVGGILPGPLGTVAKTVGGALAPMKPQILPAASPMLPIPVPGGTPMAVPTGGLTGTIQRLVPGGATGYTVTPGTGAGGAPSGYHWNKSYSYAKNAPPGTFLVRNRSVNPANPKALRRAVRREQNFVALAKRVLRGTGYTFKRSGVGAKRKTTRRR